MTLPYSGKTSCYEHKHLKEGDDFIKGQGAPAVRTETVIEAQWSNMPIEVYEEVQTLWRWQGLGNDNNFYSFTMEEFADIGEVTIEKWYWGNTPEEQKGWVEETTTFPYLTQWLGEQNFKPDETLVLKYWW